MALESVDEVVLIEKWQLVQLVETHVIVDG